ncbi:PDZ domain-containing protein [Anaerobacillus alkaliphilus]|uniref:PDZ domain-containing protein n=1 Tax=Anaerobacillus alkaliphilus TaxID=1548597 RepID=A0A4Q0VW44_9BACI|nr:PDZ domain-containing protein [Anaerobacillus alkaliphilus]RXJ01710.1 PDZ domain-containing protein [Anaerobacillus alkaliphilus]
MDFYAVGIELLKGIGFFFLHPLFYLLLLFTLFLGYKRVQRERNDFHTRVYDIVDDLLVPLFPSLLAGLLLSSFIIGFGIVIPIGVMVLSAIVHVVIMLTGQARLLSPAYTGGLTLLIALVLPEVTTGLAMVDRWISEIHTVHLGGLALLISLLMITEAFLILKNGSKQTSPQLLKSKRGKTIGVHEAKRIWILPIFFLLPAGPILTTEYWPLLNIEFSQLGVLAIPFAIGFQQVIRSTLPIHAIINNGKKVLLVGVIVLALSVLSLYISMLIPIVAIAAIIGRETVATLLKLREDKEVNMYTQRENGLVILGVIPRSPAEKMKVNVGEVVTKVNGIRVTSPQQFYEALQHNSAFCKLEIIDSQGEIRFAQTALYDGEHYQIGLLFVQLEQLPQENVI